MITTFAYAANKPGDALELIEVPLNNLETTQVEIAVEHCGICHSDLSMLSNDWGISSYPLVAGHEVIGTVSNLGSNVSGLNNGDRVGLGWHSGYCNSCSTCLQGDQNMCASAQATIIGRHGGFAQTVRAEASSVVKIPESVNPKTAGPLLCGGITVFNPLVQFDIPSTASVGVIGIGGLGHLAIKFASAFGCHVTAFTSSEDKMQEAKEMGADSCVNSRSKDDIEQAANSIDLLLSTVNVPLEWDTYLGTLKPKGRLHLLGAVLEPLPISVMSILSKQLSVSASPVGSPATIAKMLEFAGRHKIEPIAEHFKFENINEAIKKLESGKARYRIILEW